MGDYYDREGNPLDVREWARLFEDRDYKRVRNTILGDINVSTVWLGIDHSYGAGGDPIIFETMVFGTDDEERYCVRYSTEDDAIIGHIAAVEHVLSSFPSDAEAASAAKCMEALARDLEGR
jgi:hypothetical protein